MLRTIVVDGVSYDVGSGGGIYCGTCSTAYMTATKTVTVDTFPTDDDDKPLKGTAISVKFTVKNMASGDPKLNVNSTGAIRIWADGALAKGPWSPYAGHVVNGVANYVYDGTYWVFAGFDGIETRNWYPISGTAGHNGLHSLCALDWNGRLSAFTVEHGHGVKSLYRYDYANFEGFQFDFPVMCLCDDLLSASSSYDGYHTRDEGVFDIRELSLMGDNLPAEWAASGDDVYLPVCFVSSKKTVVPTAVPTVEDPPTGFSADIVVSRTMWGDGNIRLYCTGMSQSNTSENNHWVGYVYIGRCMGGYNVRLDRNHPMYWLDEYGFLEPMWYKS